MPSQAPRHLKSIVGDNIRGAREGRQLTQRQLAEQVQTDAMSVSRWERGLVMPGVHYLLKLAEALGREPAWFYIEDREAA